MDMKKITTAIITTLTMGSILGVGFSASTVNAKQASAATNNSVYLETVSSYWAQASAYYTIHYWGGSNSTSWPGKSFTDSGIKNGTHTVYKADWDPSSTNVIVVRWKDSAHTTEWNRWDWFDKNSFKAGQYNYFTNDGWSSCNSKYASVLTTNYDGKETKSFVFDQEKHNPSNPSKPSSTAQYADFWYTDAGCTTKYDGNASGKEDLTLYGKTKDLENTGVAYFKKYDWSKEKVYAWESINGINYEPNGTYNDAKEINKLDNVIVNGEEVGRISFKYHDINNVKFILTDGTENNKSTDTAFVNNAFYKFGETAATLDANVSDGKAIDTIWSIVSNMGATQVDTAYGKKDYTICDIKNNQPAVKAEIISKYNALRTDSVAKATFDSATLNTFNTNDYGDYAPVSFSDVLNEIAGYDIVSGASSSNQLMINGNGNVSTACIIAGLVTVSLAGLGLFLLKKKKTA